MISDVLHELIHQIIFYYQQRRKSSSVIHKFATPYTFSFRHATGSVSFPMYITYQTATIAED